MTEVLCPYRYTTLSPQSIRLLELHKGNKSDEISFSLHEVVLNSDIPYESISYAWGDPTKRVDVFCDGKSISVTRNLKDALLRLRDTAASRVLWEDAICINQNNVLEKGLQVQLMSQIYDNATKVCVWLGHMNVESQPAFEFISETVANRPSTQTVEMPISLVACWSALTTLFSAAWFSRYWVVQEVYSHDCDVYCGEYVVPWRHLVIVARYLIDLKALQLSRDYYMPQNAFSVIQIDTAGVRSASGGVLDSFRDFECSDQRDRVYALLSIPPFYDLQPPIVPNYSKTVVEVFEEATVRLMMLHSDLRILSRLEHGVIIDDDWPTWVPRWDRPRTTQMLSRYASGLMSCSQNLFIHRPGSLVVKGVRISTVIWISSVISGSSYNYPAIDDLMVPYQEWSMINRPQISSPNDTKLDLIAMTFTVGLDTQSNLPPANRSQFRLDFLAYLLKNSNSPSMLGLTADVLLLLSEQALGGDAINFHSAAMRGCNNKRFLSLHNEGFSLGPRATQVGDVVVLLYGSSAPCVLRPQGSFYQYVGECYIHNHMHGEATQLARPGKATVEEFELR